MELTGRSIIGFHPGTFQGKVLYGINPATGEQIPPAYYSASLEEVGEAVELAARAFAVYSHASGREKAVFLRMVADRVDGLRELLLVRTPQETGLPAARIQTEIGRTCHQLRLFADLVEEGSWIDARIDRGDPHREPQRRPDVRSLFRPLGPVAVFGSSNFPLAFSVAGGDTASALAAGNPVIVKAHPAHPGTSELVGRAVQDAVRDCHLPEGVFSLLYDAGFEIGTALVKHPLVRAAAFTGSRSGGLALMGAVSSRPVPIPFFAEMSSVNPVFILPGAMREKRDQIAAGLSSSVTLGAGQFCTNPGLVVMAKDAEGDAFVEKMRALMGNFGEFTMLTPGISSAYHAAVSARSERRGVKTVVGHTIRTAPGGCQAGPALFLVDAASYLSHPELSAEIFGPTTLLVMHSNREQLLDVARTMEGQLTATLHGTEKDLEEFRDLLAILETRVGRLIFNGFPTGVEVSNAMVHGGPYPATSDGRTTSVGARAIYRFVRPVCYQSFPETALPDELKDNNPLGISRMVDGTFSRDAIS
ncbi:MAG: aldehyde dehydrogenase (NADP(+)) [Acidobacteriia bacterium]|nr:aldehyde dehydrogenase (NADP(+)) [Terriglobia bacterium]